MSFLESKVSLFLFKNLVSLAYFFWQYWGLNSGPQAWLLACTLPISYTQALGVTLLCDVKRFIPRTLEWTAMKLSINSVQDFLLWPHWLQVWPGCSTFSAKAEKAINRHKLGQVGCSVCRLEALILSQKLVGIAGFQLTRCSLYFLALLETEAKRAQIQA